MAENFRKCITAADDGQQAATLLCNATGLSRSRIKDAMQKGAVWLKKKGKGKNRRLRRATAAIAKDDTLSIYYDEGILQTPPLSARLVADQRYYSVWEKPAGMLCQGTEYGDHCSLLRLAELSFAPRRPVFLLHRLDREASGLVLIGHNKKAAAHFSALFKERKIDKRYLALVAGCPGPVGSEHTVTPPSGRQAGKHQIHGNCRRPGSCNQSTRRPDRHRAPAPDQTPSRRYRPPPGRRRPLWPTFT